MDSYQDYNHGANGLVILNEDGFDRLILGEEGPDPHVGKRIAPFTGLLIHERSGFERGGFGAFPSENGDLVALGLDTSRGEALSLIAYNEGMIGVYLNDGGDFISCQARLVRSTTLPTLTGIAALAGVRPDEVVALSKKPPGRADWKRPRRGSGRRAHDRGA